MLKAKTTRKVYDNAGNEWNVHGWYLLKNGWEYWQLEPVDADGNMFGFVMGFAHEFGTFNIQAFAFFVGGALYSRRERREHIGNLVIEPQT